MVIKNQKVTFPGASKKEGMYEFLSKNGSRKRIETWRKGKLIRKVNFVNGELNGLYDMYNENGQLETRITFKNGLKDGNMYEFLPNGFVERIRTFNKKISQIRKSSIFGEILRYTTPGARLVDR